MVGASIVSSNTGSQDVSLNVEVFRLEYISSRKTFRLFLSIEVEGQTRRTTKSTSMTWNETLKFVSKDNSTMKLIVFRKRRLGKDDILGSSMVELASLAKDELVTHTLGHSAGPPITIQFKVSIIALVDIPNAVAKINVREAGDTLERIVGRLDILVAISTSLSELNPIAKTAVSLFRNVHQAVRAQISRDQKVVNLMEAMLEACAFLEDTKDAEDRIHESDGQRKLVCKLVTDIIKCFHFVQTYAGKKFVSRLVSNIRTDWHCEISKYSNKFLEFQNRWSIRAVAHTQVSARRLLGIAQKQLSLAMRKELIYSAAAHYQAQAHSAELLLTPSSDNVALAVNEWLDSTDEDVPRTFVLYGDDPSTMSAIAHNIAKTCDDSGCLASSFKGNKYRKSHLLFPTIARDLAELDAGFRKALEAVGVSTLLRLRYSLSEQFRHLLLHPVAQSSFVDPMVIVVDACAPEIVRLLLWHSRELPHNVRLFVTTRHGSTVPPPSEVAVGVMVHVLREEDPVSSGQEKWKTDWINIFAELFFSQRLFRTGR